MDRVPRPLDVFDRARYGSHQALSFDGSVILHWNYDHEEGVVNFAVEAPTTGWTGIGISPSGSMLGADIMLGWMDPLGGVHFQDRMALAYAMPPIDASQDLYDIRVGQILVDLADRNATSFKSVPPI